MDPPMCIYVIDSSLQKSFSLRVQWTNLNILLNSPQSSMSLFDTLVIKKTTAVSKSVLDLFMINNNFVTTEWNNPTYSNSVVWRLPSLWTIFLLQDMWPRYWSPHQIFICTPPTVRPYRLLMCCNLSLYSPPNCFFTSFMISDITTGFLYNKLF